MNFDAARIEVRPFEEADLDAAFGIAEILSEAPHWSRERYEELLPAGSSRPRIALVACDSLTREVVGFAIAGLIAPEAELESIAVAEHAQRRGIGRRLLSALAVELRQQGIQELLLEVRSSNLPAIRFYESENFKQIGVRRLYYADPKEDATLMSLHLV
jgi:ribosomal-protein-alanine N-acetyltransferase